MSKTKQTRLPGHTVDHLLEKGDTIAAKAELEQLLLKGMNSGSAIRVAPQFWSDLRAKIKQTA